ncbi:MAG: competence protein ComEC [Candidatus Paceibacteria bacterium]|jgi:competence protein ComEC
MNGLHKNLLVIVCGALLTGVLFRNFFYASWEVLIIGFLIVCLFGLFSLHKKKADKIVIGLLFIIIGFGWSSYMATDVCSGMFDSFVDESIQIRGIVASEPSSTGVRQTFNIKPIDMNVVIRGESNSIIPLLKTGQERRCFKRQKFRVSTDAYPEVLFGDLLEVSGKIQKPENFTTDFDREFDYISYLGKDNIYYTLSFAQAEVVESSYKWKFRRGLFAIKKSFLSKIERFVPEPESALLGGILLGEKQSLGDELEDAFVSTGLIHIVVLSGYNVSIVAEAMTYVLAFLPRAIAYSSSSFGILVFMILTGANAPIVRASIMAILLLAAKFLGRPTEAGRMLLLVATVMVLINPSILVHDVSFHLSFLATLGLLYMFPVVDNFFAKKIPKLWGLRSIASATISTQILVLPYLLWKIGAFSLISPITNIIVLPFIPASMLLGFFTGVFGYIFSPLASIFSYLSYFLLKIVIEIVFWFSNLSFALISVPEIPFVGVFLVYVLLGYLIWQRKKD